MSYLNGKHRGETEKPRICFGERWRRLRERLVLITLLLCNFGWFSDQAAGVTALEGYTVNSISIWGRGENKSPRSMFSDIMCYIDRDIMQKCKCLCCIGFL